MLTVELSFQVSEISFMQMYVDLGFLSKTLKFSMTNSPSLLTNIHIWSSLVAIGWPSYILKDWRAIKIIDPHQLLLNFHLAEELQRVEEVPEEPNQPSQNSNPPIHAPNSIRFNLSPQRFNYPTYQGYQIQQEFQSQQESRCDANLSDRRSIDGSGRHSNQSCQKANRQQNKQNKQKNRIPTPDQYMATLQVNQNRNYKSLSQPQSNHQSNDPPSRHRQILAIDTESEPQFSQAQSQDSQPQDCAQQPRTEPKSSFKQQQPYSFEEDQMSQLSDKDQITPLYSRQEDDDLSSRNSDESEENDM